MPRAIGDLTRVSEMTRREGDTTLELAARIQLARAASGHGRPPPRCSPHLSYD